jgi:pyruvate,water dikinase
MFLSNKLKKTLKDFDYDEKFAEVLGKDKRINEFSVRSSTANEDGESTSFAGQFDTYLNVSYRNLEEYILRCAKSLYKVNVLSYCNEQKIPLEELKMNIIIQEMVEPEYSGILFTSNPMGILNESVIVVGPGVGSGVVEDKVDTTTYYYNTTDNLYYYETQSDNCVILSEERVEELINLSKNLVSIFGDKLDIEFAVCDGVLYILQARKITTLSDEKVVVLDNSNIVESYPGVSLPFTDSFVNLAYTGVFKGVCHRIIKDKKYLESLEDVYQNMVGSCNGRMYYKISNWYHILKGMPSSKKIIKNWQEMLGVEIKTYDDTKMKLSPFTKIAVYTNIIKEINKSQKNMSKLNEDFVEINNYFKEKYSKELTNKELVVLFEQVKSKVLDNWDITLINDMYAFIYTALSGDKNKEYISNIKNLESMKPVIAVNNLWAIASLCGMNSEEYKEAAKEYIEKYAREQLGFHKTGEIVFKDGN